jgi:gluconolactonase
MMNKMKSIVFVLVTAIVLIGVSAGPSFGGQAESLVAPGATIQKTSGFTATEGPATDADGNIWFTEVFASRIQKWTWKDGKTALYREDTGTANGMMFDSDGTLVICEMGNGRIVRDDTKGNVTVIADSLNGEDLRGPNDLWIAPNGGIYFSHTAMGGSMMGGMPGGGMPSGEPPSGGMQGGGEMPSGGMPGGGDMAGGAPSGGEMPAGGGMPGGAMGGIGDTSDLGIVYISPDGKKVSLVTTDITSPNGLIGTPDGKILYVGDGGNVFSYKINSDGTLSDKALFCESGTDGMAMDEYNNVYLTQDKEILIYSPAGKLLEKIETPDGCSNVEFCGKDRKTLFFTYHENIYTLKMAVRGCELPIDSKRAN